MLSLWSWFLNRRRRKLCAAPFPDEWEGYLQRNLRLFSKLPPHQQAKLRDDLRVFIADKYWEGCNGQEINDEIQVTIAGTACLLTLNLAEDSFGRVQTILVYPDDYVAREQAVGPDGVVREGPSPRHGEAWLHGPVILSWAEAKDGGRNAGDGRNVILHEFAHQLDMLDGVADGMPPLPDKAAQDRWQRVMQQEQLLLHRDLRHGRRTLLDPYAATNAQEFFAVATEFFYEKPRAMQARHPELYEILRDFYRLDPLTEFAAGH